MGRWVVIRGINGDDGFDFFEGNLLISGVLIVVEF